MVDIAIKEISPQKKNWYSLLAYAVKGFGESAATAARIVSEFKMYTSCADVSEGRKRAASPPR